MLILLKFCFGRFFYLLFYFSDKVNVFFLVYYLFFIFLVFIFFMVVLISCFVIDNFGGIFGKVLGENYCVLLILFFW